MQKQDRKDNEDAAEVEVAKTKLGCLCVHA